MKQNSRFIAARIIHQVAVKGRSMDVALASAPGADPRDGALIQEISYGVLRHYFCLNYMVNQLLSKPMRKKDQDVAMLLMVGLYQLIMMRIPAHAAVSETVSATRGLRKPWARGLVNAVLRGYQRRRKELVAEIRRRPTAVSNHPRWLLRSFFSAWPDDFKLLIRANNSQAAMSLRVNLNRTDRKSYLDRLNAKNIKAIADPEIPAAIDLKSPVTVDLLPGFREGDVSVQDKSAQQAALLLDIAPGQRVLDACAAPGGKTGHILELVNGDLDLMALDVSEQRLTKVRENLQRLDYRATCIAGDAVDPDPWWDGQVYDRILLDAPCSGTGVIRRHPDIKLHRTPEDIQKLVTLQSRMLSSLWKLLAPGGKLLYCTCSVLADENDEQLSRFVAKKDDARPAAISAAYARSVSSGWQVLTGTNGMDGFYYGCLQKGA